ncbi:sulfate ABC transporter substrate-binding protein [Aeromicrobium fastidiosum]|uniref:Sulfate ABC transporter substrate-binding protein n=1 Tax=Aeromicrobium fastidiosum TaxID=52699 RepID=A0A641AKW8_9ACTN|nr:sulfate ABC transporter substrate-binding protein [Aeromicrobium fastidiosum]KAA1374596.1 sulfate ABC transporter substrate-binding protein [Aeromicrobium fastidiosum]MBP2390863.1 sulfate transport system substrate-binding protein [Aeromicrobium fastidiosum]
MRIFSRKRVATAVAVSLSAAVLGACGGGSDTTGGSTQLSLVAYSVPKAADGALQKAFEKTADGKGITFRESYGASGDQSRAVVSGLKADVTHFSLTPDTTRLVDEGLVAKDWDQTATKGILSTSVVSIIVRKGNPKNIQSFADLAKPGIGIVTPNPGSSGSARWNILAAYQEQIANGASEADAEAYLKKVFANVEALPGSGRDATTAFQGGTGDVLLSYENEAIFARQQGEDIDYVVPKKNLLIQNPGAVTTKAPAAAKKFLAFGESAAGQKIFAQFGFRPVEGVSGVDVGDVEGANDPSDPFPAIDDLATIDTTFGGWGATNKKFFDENDGIITKIIAASGKS